MGGDHRRLYPHRIGRVDQQDIHLLLQHVFHVADLFGDVMARIGHVHLGADIRRRLIQRLLHGDEVVVVHFLERHTDRDLLGQRPMAGRQHSTGDDKR